MVKKFLGNFKTATMRTIRVVLVILSLIALTYMLGPRFMASTNPISGLIGWGYAEVNNFITLVNSNPMVLIRYLVLMYMTVLVACWK